jgi:hypothetical protein
MSFALRDRLVSGLALTLLLALSTSCSTTGVQPSASPGSGMAAPGGSTWDQDRCRLEGGVWRAWGCDYPFGTGGGR